MDSSTLTLRSDPFPIIGEIPEFNANSVDPDQAPRSAASDLGLHSLPMSLAWDARPKFLFPVLNYI